MKDNVIFILPLKDKRCDYTTFKLHKYYVSDGIMLYSHIYLLIILSVDPNYFFAK